MGRRSLRAIDAKLDLSRHFCQLDDLARPLRPAALFGRAAPLEIEIGSGKGLFLAQAAHAQPSRDFLGVELAYRYARYTAARLAKLGLANARAVHGDGARFLREWLEDASVVGVHVYFPDPWWKQRHKKRRVLNEAFLRAVERVLQPGGRFHFWTDVNEYFVETLARVRAVTSLAGPFAVAEEPADHDLDYRTHFERRTRLHGDAVYRASWEHA